MRLWRFLGLEAAPGQPSLDSDAAWLAVVRAWWGLGATWALCIDGERSGEVAWHLALPATLPTATEAVVAHLIGAKLEPGVDFSEVIGRLKELPFKAAMAGHPDIGDTARVENAVRSLLGRPFLLLILAKCVTRPGIDAEIRRLAQEEQFLRDEFLSRPGLERDNHAAASRYIDLIDAANERASAGLQEGAWCVRVLMATGDQDDLLRAQSIIHAAYSEGGGRPEPLRWQSADDRRSLTFARTAELAALTRPPRREMAGFPIEMRVRQASGERYSKEAPLFATVVPAHLNGPAIALGRVVDEAGNPDRWIDVPVADLCRHLLIAGMTGSGKTVSCEHLLLELWREHRIPWLVIEPGLKAGYRRLLRSEIGTDIRVWSLGVPGAHRLALNPMCVPRGVSLSEHTDALFAVISAAFELVPPMPEVLATAIERTYSRHGWDLVGSAPAGNPPRLADLIDTLDQTTRELGYSPDIADNIRAGLLLRLRRLSAGPLAPELNARSSQDFADLVSRPTIIELCALPTAETQSLVMGLIALRLRHHWRMRGQSEALGHVTVIEEAHRLLRAVPETAANASRNRAVEDVANMLAELRAFGAGLVIVDQTPSALVPSVIANTGTKLLHRLDHPADRELAGRAAGLPCDAVDLLGALKPGEGILRSDRRPRPFRLRMPNPSITYARERIPRLTNPEPSRRPGDCPVCKRVNCMARALGEQTRTLGARLVALQQALLSGEDAAWEWALQQVRAATQGPIDPHAPLCFLVALGNAASFSGSTLDRLQAAFETRTRGTAS